MESQIRKLHAPLNYRIQKCLAHNCKEPADFCITLTTSRHNYYYCTAHINLARTISTIRNAFPIGIAS